MNWRTAVSIANLGAIALAFFILFEYPQYSNEAFYILLAWMVAGFVLLYAFRPRLPMGAPGSTASPFPSNAPTRSTAPTTEAPLASNGIPFCIYCAAPISPGARACPNCGHALPRS